MRWATIAIQKEIWHLQKGRINTFSSLFDMLDYIHPSAVVWQQ